MIGPVTDVGADLSAFMPRAEAETAINTMQADIDTRAKSSALAAVATTGDYVSLSNKPVIPPAGITAADLSAALASYVTTTALTSALATAGVSATRLTATLGAGGTVTIAHGKTVAPVIVPVSRYASDQEFVAVVGAVTATQVTLTGKRSRGTLLLTSGPFEPAVSGDVVEVLVIGR